MLLHIFTELLHCTALTFKISTHTALHTAVFEATGVFLFAIVQLQQKQTFFSFEDIHMQMNADKWK